MSQTLALIIEDDLKLANIFGIALESAGCKTEIIPDGKKALARLGEIVPDIVVLDLHLPHISGQDLLHYIRANERLARTQVILATADALLADHLRKEADLILLKPVSPLLLRELATRLRPESA